MAATRLTGKQEMFIQEYLVDFNGTRAAIAAGYAVGTAAATAYENLRKPHIAIALGKAIAERHDKTQVTADYVLSRLMANAERAMQEYPVFDRKGNPTGEYQYRGDIANSALALLGKHLSLFVERTEISGPDGGPIQYEDEGQKQRLMDMVAQINARQIDDAVEKVLQE